MSQGPAAEPKQYVVAHIRERLARDDRVNDLNIHVQVVGETVFLTGEVETAARRDAVAEVVRELLPDYEVRNQVGVRHLHPPEEAEAL